MIWEANVSDLPKLERIAAEFANTSKFVDVDMDVFCSSWKGLIESGTGTIFVLDDFHGAMGVIAYPDISSGEPTASELFWLVLPEYRGKGLALLERYEEWAKNIGCKKAIMVHLEDSMPDKLKGLYESRDYELMETSYIKEL
jgi:GNAT superfamily N-acetyltransferase